MMIVLMIGLGLLLPWVIYGVLRPAKPNIRPEIRMLVALLERDEDWQKDKHVWFHPSGVALWVGNLDNGLSVKWGAKTRGEYVALWEGGDARLTPAEYRLAKAAMKGAQSDADVLAVARRIEEMYGTPQNKD